MQDMPEKPALSPLPGLGTAVLIATVSFLLSMGNHALDPLVLSMLISMIIGNLAGPTPALFAGVVLSHRYIIPLGIILYGSQMDIRPLGRLGIAPVIYVILMVLATLAAVTQLSKRFGIDRNLGLLLAAGSSICGASAIVVLSPVLKARKEDTSVALLSITVLGLSGVIAYPLLQELFSLSDHTYALLCGSTLFQVGQVKAAASLISREAMEIALPVKLLRVGALLPVAIAFSFLADRGAQRNPIPWYLIWSLVMALIVNFVPGADAFRSFAGPFATFVFSVALAGIGLSIELESIFDVGLKPVLIVFLGWLVMVGLFLAGSWIVF
ncbi:MAG: putative sulfate exporter family transporter [Nitrospirota bacterium]|nr:putative sulfate exporter family transporter [Nitrospirota bacterium]